LNSAKDATKTGVRIFQDAQQRAQAIVRHNNDNGNDKARKSPPLLQAPLPPKKAKPPHSCGGFAISIITCLYFILKKKLKHFNISTLV
jgi:hypothetical protein